MLDFQPGVTYSYDPNGNLISKSDANGTTSYTWDVENRLASVTLPGTGGTVSFLYDPFGRRIEKVSPSGTTIYAYDGDNVVEELDGGGMPVARYAQGLGIDEPLAMYRGGVSYYYNADGLGSITSLTDASGQIAASYTYDSFGKLTASTGTVTNPFRYTGREYGTDTGLYYYRARYYDSSVGRFISEDPLGFVADVNFYAYVRNKPAILVDPFGLSDIVVTVTRTWSTGTSTTGTMSVTVDGQPQYGGYSMEPPASATFPRIPPGEYPADVYSSPHFNGTEVLRLEDVPGRNGIEVHPGNYPGDTEGCILPGRRLKHNFIGDSRNAFNNIMLIINETIRSDVAQFPRNPTSIRVRIQ